MARLIDFKEIIISPHFIIDEEYAENPVNSYREIFVYFHSAKYKNL
jgi:hypothetical protein